MKTTDLRGVGYGRASNYDNLLNSDGLRKNDSTMESQEARVRLHADHLSQTVAKKYRVLEFIGDEGFSGKNSKRPGYQKLLRLVRSGQIQFIIATELSRLSRSVIDFLELVRLCEQNNVAIIIIGLNIDTSSPFGKMLVVILVALAEFEREMTRVRGINNALTRLFNDGKINGASEILGLVRDPNRKGHFVHDPEGIRKLEGVLKLLLKFSSKKKVLAAAKEIGLTDPNGKEITMRVLDGVIENIQWRYRGRWRVDLDKHYRGQNALPTEEKQLIVKLPHGPVVDESLLDQVHDKLERCARKPIKAGKNGHIYLLSNLLVAKDGSKFQGQPGKDIRYYFNPTQKLRIRCEELDRTIITEVKKQVHDDSRFAELVEASVKRRQIDLPKVEDEIRAPQKSLDELEDKNQKLSARLLAAESLDDNLMRWMSDQVVALQNAKQFKIRELESLKNKRSEILDESGLRDIQKQVKKALQGFDGLTRVQQRTLLEKIISKITVVSDKEIEIRLFDGSDPGVVTVIPGRTPKLDLGENGGVVSAGPSAVALPASLSPADAQGVPESFG
ncbi:MAG TPA: recombinase family protein, partial [Pseudobdellovibrionaceae bacterium]|nr:recombinase family protein [Pseudobdellovibrionaceae bacterium]